MPPLITVIVPVYNADKFLNRCVNSILKQTYKNIEVILIDDGSMDNSPSICDQFVSTDNRLKVIHKKNEGPGAARRTGFGVAQGDYITFIDADDYIDENMYMRLVDVAGREQADIIQCGYMLVKDDGELIEICEMQEQTTAGNYDCASFYARQKNVTNYLWNKLFKYTLFQGVEFPSLFTGEDACVMTQLFGNANKVVTIPAAYCYYVMTEDSLSRKPFTVQRLDLVKAGIFMHDYYKNRFPDLAEFSALYICSSAARCYCYLSQIDWPDKKDLQSKMKVIFGKYYSSAILRRHSKDISKNRWGLIKAFRLRPSICNFMVKHFDLLVN